MICVFLLVLSFCTLYTTFSVRDYLYFTSADKREETPEEPVQYEIPESEELDYLTDAENARLSDFELRIARMKDELAKKNVPIYSEPRKGTVADIYHPDVQNLDHNIINDYTALPDVEIAE